MSAETPGGTCAACGAQLASGQRYCLRCGERTGERSSQLTELLRRARAADESGDPAAGAPPTPPWRPSARRASLTVALARVSALRLPSRRVSAVLVLAFLGFGVLLGNAAGSRVAYGPASARAPLKLMLPASSPTASASTGEAEETSPVEPPEASEEATPEAAPEAPTPTPAPTPKPGSGGSGQGGGGGSGGGGDKGGSPTSGTASKLPAIKHVFVVMLSDEPYAAVFGPESKATYLAHTLEKKGELLARYYAIAHEQLPNGIALLSGQGPTPATAANCPTYADVAPATPGGEGQTLGEGCVYPATTPTLPGQLEVKHQSWRAYVQGIGEGGPPACSHPAPGASDPSATTPAAAGADGAAGAAVAPVGTQAASPYATFRNPFVYFHSLADAPSCAQNDVGIAALDEDLKSAKRTPALAYIVPDRCHDGSPGPCPGGGPGGPAAADGLLQQIVPKILASPAYKQGGLLVITGDEAPSSGEFADSSSCCGLPRFPNMPAPTGTAATLPAEGGGQVGALLLSPYVKGGVITQEQYDHFSLLRTIEDLFSLKHLGYAGAAKVPAFAPSLFAATPKKPKR